MASQDVIKRIRQVFSVEGAENVIRAYDMVAAGQGRTEGASLSLERSFANLERRYDKGIRYQQDYARAQEQVNAAVAQNPALAARGNQVLANMEQHYKALGVTNDNYTKGVKSTRYELINLSRQVQDVFVSLTSGQNVGTVLVQQGTQIADVFAASAIGAKGLLKYLWDLVKPFTPLIAGFTAVGAAAYAVYSLGRSNLPPINEQLDEHSRILGVVKNAYRDAADKAGKFYDVSKAIVELQATNSLSNLRSTLRNISEDITKSVSLPSELPEISFVTGDSSRFATTSFAELNKEINKFNASVRDAAAVREYADAVANIALAAKESGNIGLAKEADKLAENAKGALDVATKIFEAERALRLLQGRGTNADREAFGLSTPKAKIDSYDKYTQSTRDRIELLRLEATTAGRASHAVEAHRIQLEAERAAKEAKRTVDQATIDSLKAEYVEAKKLSDLAKIRADIAFDRQTIGLPSTEVQIAQSLRSVYGNDVQAALASSEAAQLRFNEALKQANTFATDFITSLVEGLARGEDMTKTLESALSSLGATLIRMGSQNLVGNLFSGVGAAGQQTGGLLGGGITSLLGLGGSLGGPIGGALALGGGLLASLFGGNSAKKQAQQQAQQQAAQAAQQAAEEARRKAEQQAETAANYRHQAASLGIDTGTRAGALAKLELDIQRERAEAAKVGGEAITAYEQLAQAKRLALEKEWQDKIAALRLSYEDRIFAAQNDTSTLAGKLAEYDRRAAQERADAIKTYGQVYVELEQAQAAERGKIIKDAMREHTDYYDGLRKSINSFTTGLQFGNLSTLSPAEQYLAARNQFQEQYQLALSGDRTAQGNITGVAQTLLEQARNYLGPSAQYGDLVALITSQLKALPDIAMANDPQVKELQSISASSTQMVDVLTAVQSELEQTRAENRALQQQMARLTADGNQRTETVAEEIGKMRSAFVLGLQEIKLRAA